MKVRLTITHTEQLLSAEWRSEVNEAVLAPLSDLDSADTIHEEVYFFKAKNRAEARQLKKQLQIWAKSDPLDLQGIGWFKYEVAVVR